MEIWILPVFDPDEGASLETLVDRLIPKDTDSQSIDFDTTATDTTPFFEPGEADWTQVLDVGVRPKRIYGGYRMLTAANAPFVGRDPATPFSLEQRLGEIVQVRVRKPHRVRQPSVLVCAVASPAMDDTTTVVESALAENEWSRVKYARQMLEQAHMSLIGLASSAPRAPLHYGRS